MSRTTSTGHPVIVDERDHEIGSLRKLVRDQAAEIARLTAELAAARAVPADVEAAIEELRRAEEVDARAMTGQSLAARVLAEANLRTAIARAIRDATTAAVGEFIDRHAKRLCEQAGHVWNRDDEEAEEWASDVHDVLNHLCADETGHVHDGRKQSVAARAVTTDVCQYLDCSASDLLAVVASLYESRARAIGEATARRVMSPTATAVPHCSDAGSGTGVCVSCSTMHVVPAPPSTVGELLATGITPTDSVEFVDAYENWSQIASARDHLAVRIWSDGEWYIWSERIEPYFMSLPARLVPASEADADPSQRGPLPKGG